jgi:hypothetical protein
MAYDDPKLPRPVLRGEELFVGNDKEPYFRDPDYLVYLDVADLKIHGGFDPVDITESSGPKAMAAPALRGLAKLEGRDDFAVAGFDVGKNPKIEFHLRTVAETETRLLWAARMGYSMYDWEFENEAGFWVQGYCTPAEFDRVLDAIRTRQVERLRVALTTTMWTKQKSSGFMAGRPMTLHVAPPTDKEATSPATEGGFIPIDHLGRELRCQDTDADRPRRASEAHRRRTAAARLLAARLDPGGPRLHRGATAVPTLN